MQNALTWILFAVGIVLVVKGGDFFVDAARDIAAALRVPKFIIGATIVSFATTMPEMIVSCLAASQGKIDMAIGNAVGSVTANTALILAVAMVAMSIKCDRKRYMTQILLLIASAGVLYVSCLSGVLDNVGGIVLFVLFLAFMIQNVVSAKRETMHTPQDAPLDKKGLLKNIVFFIVGAAAIVVGSQMMITYGSKIALWLGVSERIVAVTLIAVGTSLPELVTTVTAIIKRESALSIGNIIGANIIDLSLILPVCSVVSGQALPVSAQSVAIDLPVCLAVTLLAMLPLLWRQRASKVQGALLLLVYLGYLVIVI